MKPLQFSPVSNPQKMSSYWKKEWRVVALIVLTGTLFNACLSLGPVLQGKIIDQLLAGAKTAEVLGPIGVFVLVIAAIQGMRFLKRYYVRVFANRTGAAMRKTVYHNLMHRDMAALSDERAGDLMTKAISDVDACVEGMRKCTTEVFDTGVLMVSYFITLLYHGVGLTLCACALIPAAMVLAEALKKVIFKYTSAYRSQLSEVSHLTYETVENAMLYRIFSADENHLRRYRAELDALEKRAVRANLLENSMQPLYNVIAMTGVAAIVFFGGQKVAGGLWTVGEFSAYLTLFSALAVKASKAAKLFHSVQKAQVSWLRIRPYLSSSPEDAAVLPEGEATLQVESLSFTYPDAEKATLQNVRFSAKAGQLIGITGPVASGKSTLALALLGLYPYGGSIRLNGRELRTCSAGTISASIAYLGHDSQLLSGTIAENITLGDAGDVLPVLRDACFDRDLAEMPLGTETPVGASGVQLSGGQQTRLALARALYRKSPILVLDDPFSAVDRGTEDQILRNLTQHYRDRLILLVSHRITCFPHADFVILVENGSALCAPHSVLLETSAGYRAIAALQEGGGEHAPFNR